MAALLFVGSDASLRIDDHRTRSRRFFSRGLLLSGALHLSLLFLFLTLTNHGEEGFVRVISDPTHLMPPPESRLIDIPPPLIENASRKVADKVVIDPVKRLIEETMLDPGKIDAFTAERPGAVSGTEGKKTGDGGPSGLPPGDETRIYSPNEVQELPVAVDAPEPPYPSFARDNGITGQVYAKVFVRADGSVARVEVRGAKLFLETTQETLYRWRFKPARMNDRPVSVWVEIPVRFEL